MYQVILIHRVTRPAAASLVLHTIIGPAPEYVTEAGSTTVELCRAQSFLIQNVWSGSLCRSPFGPGTEDIHLFKVIDQLMAFVKTFLFTCCGFFSQFIVSQAMQSLQYGEYSLIVLYNNIIIYIIIYIYLIIIIIYIIL